VITVSFDEDNNNKDVGNSEVELVAATVHDFKRQAQLPMDHFEKLLEVTCLNHMYPIKHKQKECTMMQNYMTTGSLANSKKPEGDSAGKVVAPFPEEKVVISIYGRPAPLVMPQTQAHRPCDQLSERGGLGVPTLVRISDHF
jgi:hypothetical protein